MKSPVCAERWCVVRISNTWADIVTEKGAFVARDVDADVARSIVHMQNRQLAEDEARRLYPCTPKVGA